MCPGYRVSPLFSLLQGTVFAGTSEQTTPPAVQKMGPVGQSESRPSKYGTADELRDRSGCDSQSAEHYTRRAAERLREPRLWSDV